MLSNEHIIRTLRESAILLHHSVDANDMRFVEVNNRQYTDLEFDEFKRDLLEAGNKVKILFMEYNLTQQGLRDLFREEVLVLAFRRQRGQIVPVLVNAVGRRQHLYQVDLDQLSFLEQVPDSDWLTNEQGEIICFAVLPYKSLVSDQPDNQEKMGPVRRFFRLLSTERREIIYILFYAVIIGLIGLILPLGIQTTVELISGGVFFSSVYLLIGLVILGVLFAGALQIVQISLVEHLQRRIFTKAAFEFAFRIPRIRMEALLSNYAPELVNRFFDIMTLQKGLPKLLIDLSSAVIQIFFGLLLLSLYHPFFVFFSLILVTVLVIIFSITGPRGLDSSLHESKYKYKVVQWLEELARSINAFKLAGNTNLPVKKTDYNVNNYLKYRKSHFSILITQFSFILIFKTLVTGGLLIMGTVLVVQREITLGQFVASEIVIILLLGSVEKVIMYMDVVYDLLTAVDKISHVTDLPMDKSGGVDFPAHRTGKGYSIQIKNLSYKFPDKPKPALQDISLNIQAGERVCITGSEGSGKTVLTNILAGLYTQFEGSITVNQYSLRDLDLTHFRNKIAKNISPEDLFDGTILENITVGKSETTMEDVTRAMIQAGLQDKVSSLPDGLNTHIISGGKGLSANMVHRLILARCIAKRPELLILNDYFSGLRKPDKLNLIQTLMGEDHPWTVVLVSNDPLVMAACDRVVVLDGGRKIAEGDFNTLWKQEDIQKHLE